MIEMKELYTQIHRDAFPAINARLPKSCWNVVDFKKFCEDVILPNIDHFRVSKGDLLLAISDEEDIIINDNETGATEVLSPEKTIMLEEILKVI